MARQVAVYDYLRRRRTRAERPFDRPNPIATAASLDAATSAATVPVTCSSSITASAYLP